MLRPQKHFSPKYGWMNDPNGTIFFRGMYHLFFQHNPHGLIWDHMHWGHARSEDLVHWEELPIAIFPDEQGDIFSGSCIVDKDNISGLAGENAKEEEPVLLAFYTSHNMDTRREMQCLAYSTDGVHLQKYRNNPIIPGKDNTPARDPQVFINPVLGGFSLCLTTEKEIEFYHSEDLLNWTKTGAFSVPDYGLSGMIECPCMFRAKVEETSPDPSQDSLSSPYVLMMSMDIPESEFKKLPPNAVPHKRVMQYFAGTFDGYIFQADPSQKEVLLVDHGPDFYAGTVFSNTEDTILIAWLGNFSENALRTPTEKEGFRGIQSFPRILTLRKTKDGMRLCQKFWKHEEEDAAGFSHSGESVSGSSDGSITGECSSGDGNRAGGCSTEEMIDGCVREVIRDGGLWSETSYILPRY